MQKASQNVALFLSKEIQNMGPFELLSDGSDIPVFAWRLKEDDTSHWTLFDLSRQMRVFGWQVPAYPLPPDMETVTIMRVVVRNGFSMDLAHLFLVNLKQAVAFLDTLDAPMPHDTKYDNGFHH